MLMAETNQEHRLLDPRLLDSRSHSVFQRQTKCLRKCLNRLRLSYEALYLDD